MDSKVEVYCETISKYKELTEKLYDKLVSKSDINKNELANYMKLSGFNYFIFVQNPYLYEIIAKEIESAFDQDFFSKVVTTSEFVIKTKSNHRQQEMNQENIKNFIDYATLFAKATSSKNRKKSLTIVEERIVEATQKDTSEQIDDDGLFHALNNIKEREKIARDASYIKTSKKRHKKNIQYLDFAEILTGFKTLDK